MQRVLITGASSGIGAAVARNMAARGAEVWLAARRADRLALEVEAIVAAGGRAHALVLDVSRPEDASAAVASLDDAVGGLDLVVANAGIGGRAQPAARTTWDDVRTVFATNVIGALATLLPVVPRMLERFARDGRRGHIAAVSSIAAELPLPVGADYGASKAALSYFLEGAQAELPARGVDVTVIHPGFIRTDSTTNNKFPMPFLLEVEEAARIIDQALVRRARSVRFPVGLVGLIGLGKALPRSVKNALVSRTVPRS